MESRQPTSSSPGELLSLVQQQREVLRGHSGTSSGLQDGILFLPSLEGSSWRGLLWPAPSAQAPVTTSQCPCLEQTVDVNRVMFILI